MTDVTPIQQPPLEDLQNARYIAQLWADAGDGETEAARAFASTCERLIDHALAGLGEPNEAAVSEALVMIRCLPAYRSLTAPGLTEREARDICAVIVAAQLRGAPPPQHPHEGP